MQNRHLLTRTLQLTKVWTIEISHAFQNTGYCSLSKRKLFNYRLRVRSCAFKVTLFEKQCYGEPYTLLEQMFRYLFSINEIPIRQSYVSDPVSHFLQVNFIKNGIIVRNRTGFLRFLFPRFLCAQCETMSHFEFVILPPVRYRNDIIECWSRYCHR